MASLGCLLVCTFGNFIAPVLVAAHTVNNLNLRNELENRVLKVILKSSFRNILYLLLILLYKFVRCILTLTRTKRIK